MVLRGPVVTCEHSPLTRLTFSVPFGLWGACNSNMSTAHPMRHCHQVDHDLGISTWSIERDCSTLCKQSDLAMEHQNCSMLASHQGSVASGWPPSSHAWDPCWPYWIIFFHSSSRSLTEAATEEMETSFLRRASSQPHDCLIMHSQVLLSWQPHSGTCPCLLNQNPFTWKSDICLPLLTISVPRDILPIMLESFSFIKYWFPFLFIHLLLYKLCICFLNVGVI